MMINLTRLPFILFAVLCLLTGLWTGLSRIGWDIFISPGSAHHGAIMVGGFLGTLIALEKIIPLKRPALLGIPAISAFSVVLFILNQPFFATVLLIVASFGLTVVFLHYLKMERSLIYQLMVAGAVQWLIGNVMLLTKQFYPLAFPWWVGFILFIILSERLELMKFLPVSKSKKKLFVIFLTLFVSGVLISFHGIGNIVSGISLICISLWLMSNDLIGITIRKNGLPKFIAISLMTGYTALLLAGIFFVTFSNEWLAYDAIVHTFFIGFVFSMIFAHGPIILPGILGSSIKPFHKILYFWLFLLHCSWLLRIFGDAFVNLPLRRMGGAISAIAILAYLITQFLTLRMQFKNADKSHIPA